MATYLSKCSKEMKTKFIVLLTLSYVVLLYILVKAMTGSEADNKRVSDRQKVTDNVDHGAAFVEDTIVSDESNDAVIQETDAKEVPDTKEEEVKDEGCNGVSVARNTDPNHTAAHLEFWRNLDENTIQMYKDAWKNFIRKENVKPKDGQFQGRGIVFVAGNRDTLQRTVTSIRLLRHYGCSLPVEVWYFTAQERPSPQAERELESLGATARDMADEKLPRPMQERRDADKQFQIKAAAIINSSFREILYLDSDNAPTRDPSYLFHSKGYTETGAIFWPDFWKTHSENRIFDILDISCRDAWEQESGQMVIDKVRSWLPLQLAHYMQDHHKVYFQFLNGDKDTFQYAWRALKYPFHMVETFLGMGGSTVWGRFCGHTMLQYDTESSRDGDAPLFVHANLMKITDKNQFMQDHLGQTVERPWQEIKRYSDSKGRTWLMPTFYIAPGGRACMDFSSFQGEPSIVVQNFDGVLGDFQDLYFEFGGIGGETRS